MQTQKLSIGLVSLAMAAGAGAWALAQNGPPARPAGSTQPKVEDHEGDEEEVITLNKAPETVRAAAIRLAGDANHITKVIKERDDEDVVRYEIEYRDGSAATAIKCAAILTAAGDLVETEKATTADRLPAAVMAALRTDYPRATFANPQIVTRTFYEIDVVIDGKRHEVKVDASGNIEDETGGSEQHGEHADDDDHGRGERHPGNHEGRDGSRDKED